MVIMLLLYFHLLWFLRQEWAVASSIFNIKAQALDHCLL